MNWVLVITVAIQLTYTRFFEVAAGTVTHRMNREIRAAIASSQADPSSLKQIPYSINAAEIEGATEILANIGKVNISSSTTVPAIDSLVYYIVLDDQGKPVAYDMYVPNFKESVNIDAVRTVLAAAFDDPRLFSWPSEDRLELYKLFDDDPNFETIVQQVRNTRGLRPADEITWRQIRQLTQDAARRYALNKGWIGK